MLKRKQLSQAAHALVPDDLGKEYLALHVIRVQDGREQAGAHDARKRGERATHRERLGALDREAEDAVVDELCQSAHGARGAEGDGVEPARREREGGREEGEGRRTRTRRGGAQERRVSLSSSVVSASEREGGRTRSA